MTGTRPAGRIASLDSLRGIAALIVVFYHFSLVLPGGYDRLMSIRPLRFVVAGDTAVLVFFVLSGFVLYLSLERHDRDRYHVFAVRRLVRLYPPVVVAVLVSAALYLLVRPGSLAALPPWITRFSWTEPPGLPLLAGHLLLVDPDRFHTLDNPMWSLVVEIRLSLLFPLLAAGIRRWPWPTLLGALIVSWGARFALVGDPRTALVDPVTTLQYLDLFAIGAVMARQAGTVAAAMRCVPAPLTAIALVALLMVRNRFYLYAAYGGSALLVAASFGYPRLARFYAVKPLVWLGERSFSLYLVHVPVLLALVHTLAGRLPIGVVLAGTLPLCLVAAELFWLAVERPSIALGRRIGRRLSRRAPPGERPLPAPVAADAGAPPPTG